ncbi:hypothetical protein ACWEJ7_22030 [Streptomyces albidoflavus]
MWDVEGDLTALRARFLTEESPMAPARFETAVAERCRHIPLGHLIGAVPFDGLELVVGSGVFVPRYESTSLVEWAVSEATLARGGRVLDLCSGAPAAGPERLARG